ncbi:MAG: hypothetical protein HZC40_13475 [Chloroflexi bacterium]|nr:hypothetical protein [Chloroflexota bacterium]
MKSTRPFLRKLRATWRDTFLLLRDFRLPLFFFALLVIGGGLVYFQLAAQAGEPLASPVESIYFVLTLVFMQARGICKFFISRCRSWELELSRRAWRNLASRFSIAARAAGSGKWLSHPRSTITLFSSAWVISVRASSNNYAS